MKTHAESHATVRTEISTVQQQAKDPRKAAACPKRQEEVRGSRKDSSVDTLISNSGFQYCTRASLWV